MSETKVCFVASSGGHLEEISRLKAIEKKYDCFLITERSEFDVAGFCENKKYVISQMNRKQLWFLPRFFALFFKAIRLLKKESPDYIITTGALIAYPFCVVGKIMGMKVIYIESFARVTSPSLTGKLLYNFSDLFIVQWEDMLEFYSKSTLGGGIF